MTQASTLTRYEKMEVLYDQTFEGRNHPTPLPTRNPSRGACETELAEHAEPRGPGRHGERGSSIRKPRHGERMVDRVWCPEMEEVHSWISMILLQGGGQTWDWR